MAKWILTNTINHDFLAPDLMKQVVKKFIEFLDELEKLHEEEKKERKNKNKNKKYKNQTKVD